MHEPRTAGPERPESVPPEATYEPRQEHWEVREALDEASGRSLFRTFRHDGSLCLEQEERDGRPDGTFCRYHPNGELARKGRYVAGDPVGEFVAYASTAPSPEALRACCVPPGAWSLHSVFKDGRCRAEHFCDRDGHRLLSDGALYPDKPADVPAEARFDEGEDSWVLGIYNERGRREGAWSWWFKTGGLKRTAGYKSGVLDGTFEERRADGALVARLTYKEGVLHGPWERHDLAKSFSDPRYARVTGSMHEAQQEGEFRYADEHDRELHRSDLGVYRSDAELSTSDVLSDQARSADEWHALGKKLLTQRRVGEALLAYARALARSGDGPEGQPFTELFRARIVEKSAAENEKALAVLKKNDGSASIVELVAALLTGVEPHSVLHRIGVRLQARPRASLDFVQAAIGLSGPLPELLLSRALFFFDVGNPEAARADIERLCREAPESADSLAHYADVLFSPFPFVPARQDFIAEASPELPEEVAQPLEELRRTVQKTATRLEQVRTRIRGVLREYEDLADKQAPVWLPPDVSSLLPAGPVPLERFDFAIEEEDEEIAIHVDETLSLDGAGLPLLMRRARLEWGALCWLCWGAGLDQPELPRAIASRPEFRRALGTSLQRYWRAQDRLTTHGLKARMHQVPGFVWEGMDIDEMSLMFARIAAEEYLELRAVLFYLADAECRSLWQDDLRPA